MSHINLGSGGTSSSGAAGVGDVVGTIIDLTKKKPRKGQDPLSFGLATLRVQEMIATTERKIEQDVRLGNPISDDDLRRLVKLNKRLEGIAVRFERKKKFQPRALIRAGIDLGLTAAQFAALLAPTSRGQKAIAAFSSPIFNPAPLPSASIGGTSTMPFVVTPAATAPGSFGGFGDVINNLITAGGQIGSALLAPKRSPGFQQAGFGSLVPAVGGAVGPALRGLRALLPTVGGVGAGAVGGELADAFQNLISGGASTLDDSAAFTDPVPGSCRPKAHVKVNPCTGKGIWFAPRGRALLFSGDLATCKRVARVNKRVQKAMPGKHHHHRKAAKT